MIYIECVYQCNAECRFPSSANKHTRIQFCINKIRWSTNREMRRVEGGGGGLREKYGWQWRCGQLAEQAVACRLVESHSKALCELILPPVDWLPDCLKADWIRYLMWVLEFRKCSHFFLYTVRNWCVGGAQTANTSLLNIYITHFTVYKIRIAPFSWFNCRRLPLKQTHHPPSPIKIESVGGEADGSICLTLPGFESRRHYLHVTNTIIRAVLCVFVPLIMTMYANRVWMLRRCSKHNFHLLFENYYCFIETGHLTHCITRSRRHKLDRMYA